MLDRRTPRAGDLRHHGPVSSRTTCASCGLEFIPPSDGVCPGCGAFSGASTNPFESPRTSPSAYEDAPLIRPGSFPLGFGLGFLLGLWGLLGCFLLGKADTKRGAGYGFLSRIGLTLVVVAIAVALD